MGYIKGMHKLTQIFNQVLDMNNQKIRKALLNEIFAIRFNDFQ